MNLLLIVLALGFSIAIVVLNRAQKPLTTTFWLGVFATVALAIVVLSWFFPLFPGWPSLPPAVSK